MNYSLLWGVSWSMAVLLVIAWRVLKIYRQNKSNNFTSTAKVVVPVSAKDESMAHFDVTVGDIIPRQKSHKNKSHHRSHHSLPKVEPPAVEPKRHLRESIEHALFTAAILGDFAMIVLGFVEANQLCRGDLIPILGKTNHLPMTGTLDNLNLILFGSLIVLWGLSGKKLYSYKCLLSPLVNWHKLLEAFGICLVAFIAINQMLRTASLVSWTYFVCAMLLVLLNICAWRLILSQMISRSGLSNRLCRRVVVIGGGTQAMRIQTALAKNVDMKFAGWVEAIKPNPIAELEEYRLGSLHELGRILRQNNIDVAVLTETESLQREGVLAVAKACENELVQFKMAPHFFETLISGLSPEIIGGMPLLGVECLPLNGFRNLTVKRIVDITGALVGLTLSIPLIVIFGALVRWESPGPILYKQVRQGRSGRLFYIIKIRSMHVNAEAKGKVQWAQPNDQRRLRIGAFMRRWNIDEVPQFWNVLVGEMSLVGPRPERPELIARFKSRVPHYQTRHRCRPGLTGWAQVNGWRGNTDLEERIRHDIWYLENWSFWLDFRIIIQTFMRQKNAY
jgi:exopolysaccharide biosynthesis polyprenyl glycosylphosphotransferase